MALRQLFRYFFQGTGQVRTHFIFCWRAYLYAWKGLKTNKRVSEKITGVQFFEIQKNEYENLKSAVKRSEYNKLMAGNDGLETTYNLSKNNKLKVKDQRYLGSCWAFAFTSMLESTIKNGKEYFQNFSENFKQSFKYWLVGFAIMAISNIIITFVLKQTIAGNEELVRSYIDTSPLLMIFSTVIYAPICEELTFRKSIKDAINNKYIYILTSGLLFGFLHIVSYINTPLDLVYLIPYASLGIVFATLYYKTNNIFSTITIHAMHNALSVLVYLSLGGLS